MILIQLLTRFTPAGPIERRASDAGQAAIKLTRLMDSLEIEKF